MGKLLLLIFKSALVTLSFSYGIVDFHFQEKDFKEELKLL